VVVLTVPAAGKLRVFTEALLSELPEGTKLSETLK
jgi:hypothetical protein